MARFGISTSSIRWEEIESEIEITDLGEAVISCVGTIGYGNITTLDDAIDMIPLTLPISANGPIGSAVKYQGATVSSKGAKFRGDDTIEIRASYRIAVPLNPYNPDDGDEQTESDRASRQIVVVDEPILSHPVAQDFPAKEKRRLSALLSGAIQPNPLFDSEGSGSETYEFITTDENGEIQEVEFSDSTVTADGITGSPLDYARLIAAGVDTYRRKAVRHKVSVVRDSEASSSEYNRVGEIVSSPPMAPSISGSYQWFFTGIDDSTSNGSTWRREYDYDLTGAGGAFSCLYKGGSASVS